MSGETERMLAREHAAGAAESGQHFVGDHQRAVAVAEPADAGEKLARPDDHPAGGLQHRLDEHRRDRGSGLLQRRFEAAEAIDPAAGALEAERAAIAIRRVGAPHREQQRRERVA